MTPHYSQAWTPLLLDTRCLKHNSHVPIEPSLWQVEWPVSLVLNHKALAQYQMLFRHFFYCKHIERLLSAVWITNKQTKFLPLDQFKVYHPSFALRQKMLNLIQNLSYYMSVEVVEPAWHTLAADIASCNTVTCLPEVAVKLGHCVSLSYNRLTKCWQSTATS